MSAHQRGRPRRRRGALSPLRWRSRPNSRTALHYLGVDPVPAQPARRGPAAARPRRRRSLPRGAGIPQQPRPRAGRRAARRGGDRGLPARARAKPDHAGAWNNLGLALQVTGDVDGASAAFRRGLARCAGLCAIALEPGARAAPAGRLRAKAGANTSGASARPSSPPFSTAIRRHAGPATIRPEEPSCSRPSRAWATRCRCSASPRRSRERGARVIVAVPPVLRALAATAPGVAAVFGADDALPPVRRAGVADVAARLAARHAGYRHRACALPARRGGTRGCRACARRPHRGTHAARRPRVVGRLRQHPEHAPQRPAGATCASARRRRA